MQNNKLQIDEQTLNDLTIFGRSNKPSVFSLFNKTVTEGGAAVMEALFKEPLADAGEINRRAALYRFFSMEAYVFPVDPSDMGAIGFYMENNDVRSQVQIGGQGFGQKFRDMVAADPDYVFVHDGVQAVLRLFHQTNRFIESMMQGADGSPYAAMYHTLKDLAGHNVFSEVRRYAGSEQEIKLSSIVLSNLDKTIRFNEREKTLQLLHLLHELDVYIAVGQVARKKGFSFGEAVPSAASLLNYEGIFHPHVENAVANDLSLNEEQNMLFLTGANMAGKSTLMKSLGIALYLGHMGFPVPAKRFVFSVKDALYTSINLADNLQQGASHYYAEVLRVKEVAGQLAAGKRLFVIFDEMFRGTNVKDAYDATVAITRAFARKSGSQFIISTHIMEAGEELQKEKLGIRYQFLPTEMKGNTPVYTRVLQSGISSDRHGMIIIQNESILEILDKGLERVA